MPFGSFEFEERTVKPKKKKPKPVPPKPAPQRSQLPSQSQPPLPAPYPPIIITPPSPPGSGGEIKILIVGRSMEIIREFLCSLDRNMTEALGQSEFTFFTKELGTISSVIAVKKRLETFFFNFSREDWSCADEEDIRDKPEIRKFTVSPAGNQQNCLDLSFYCYRAGDEIPPDDMDKTDAAWLLTDGLFLSEEADPYTDLLKMTLSRLNSRLPVCLVMTQIEHWGRFDSYGAKSVLSAKTASRLTQCAVEKLADCGSNAAVIPVQVYGGLELAGIGAGGCPTLRLSESGGFQSYIPDNCHIPAFYTIQKLSVMRKTEFLSDVSGHTLSDMIRAHYGRKFDLNMWQPDELLSTDANKEETQ